MQALVGVMVDTATQARRGRFRPYHSLSLELARDALWRKQGECHSEMLMPGFMAHFHFGVLDVRDDDVFFGVAGEAEKGTDRPLRNLTKMLADAHITWIAVARSALLRVCDGDVVMLVIRIGRGSVGSHVDVQSVCP